MLLLDETDLCDREKRRGLWLWLWWFRDPALETLLDSLVICLTKRPVGLSSSLGELSSHCFA